MFFSKKIQLFYVFFMWITYKFQGGQFSKPVFATIFQYLLVFTGRLHWCSGNTHICQHFVNLDIKNEHTPCNGIYHMTMLLSNDIMHVIKMLWPCYITIWLLACDVIPCNFVFSTGINSTFMATKLSKIVIGYAESKTCGHLIWRIWNTIRLASKISNQMSTHARISIKMLSVGQWLLKEKCLC